MRALLHRQGTPETLLCPASFFKAGWDKRKKLEGSLQMEMECLVTSAPSPPEFSSLARADAHTPSMAWGASMHCRSSSTFCRAPQLLPRCSTSRTRRMQPRKAHRYLSLPVKTSEGRKQTSHGGIFCFSRQTH